MIKFVALWTPSLVPNPLYYMPCMENNNYNLHPYTPFCFFCELDPIPCMFHIVLPNQIFALIHYNHYFYTIITSLPAARHFVVYVPYTTPTTLKTLLASGSGRYTKQPNNQTPCYYISCHSSYSKSFIPHLISPSPYINNFLFRIYSFLCVHNNEYAQHQMKNLPFIPSLRRRGTRGGYKSNSISLDIEPLCIISYPFLSDYLFPILFQIKSSCHFCSTNNNLILDSL